MKIYQDATVITCFELRGVFASVKYYADKFAILHLLEDCKCFSVWTNSNNLSHELYFRRDKEI